MVKGHGDNTQARRISESRNRSGVPLAACLPVSYVYPPRIELVDKHWRTSRQWHPCARGAMNEGKLFLRKGSVRPLCLTSITNGIP